MSDLPAFLAIQEGGAVESDPVYLSFSIQLNEAAWRTILGDIDAAGKYIALDLSPCTRSGNSYGGGLRSTGIFDPITGTAADNIVSLILPDAATALCFEQSAAWPALGMGLFGATYSTG